MIAEAIASLLGGRFRNASPENPQYSLNDPALWDLMSGGIAADSGIKVSHRSALSLAPVYQAVSVISGDVAKYPLDVYKRLANDDREVAWSHPAQYLISDQPNDEMSAFEYWRRLMVHGLLWNNAYGYILRSSRFGPPLGIINLLPDRTAPIRTKSGELAYVTEVDGELHPLFKEEVFHLKGLSLENGSGCDLVEMARNSWGLALAAEGYSSKFFANGSQTAGILEVPAAMKETAVQTLEEGLRKRTQKDNWFRVMVLRDGAKFHSVTIDAEKAQLHELREDQVRDVARFFSLPPSKLGLSDSVSYNSTEQASLNYLMSCLYHWMCSITGEAKIKLLTKEERRPGTYYVEHNLSKGLEIDVKTMNEVLEIQRRNEIINANEWRRKINLNRRSDKGGEEYINPNTKSAEKPSAKPGVSEKARTAHRYLISDAINRVARRVCFDAKSSAKKTMKFQQWLDGGAVDHRQVFDDAVRPTLDAWCAVVGGEPEPILCDLSGRFFAAIIDSLKPYLDPPHLAAQLGANVEMACIQFESTISDQLVSGLI